MGNKGSRPVVLTYEDAIRKLNSEEIRRVEGTFKQNQSVDGLVSLNVFKNSVLSSNVPDFVAKSLYSSFCLSTSRGLSLKELTCALVLLTKSTISERLKFLFHFFSDDGESVQTVRILELQRDSGEVICQPLLSAVAGTETIPDLTGFERFILRIKDYSSVCKWILDYPNQLTCKQPFTSLHQLLAGLTHLDEREVSEVGNHWPRLVNDPISKLNIERLQCLVSPPVPLQMIQGLFCALDENGDGWIDFKELVCGVSACCRGPQVERYKFCFKLFDLDRDGLLSESDVKNMVELLLRVKYEADFDEARSLDPDFICADILKNVSDKKDARLSMSDFIIWANDSQLVEFLADLLFQVCHVVLGLKPDCKDTEKNIIGKWVQRENGMKMEEGQTWYLVSSAWWVRWQQYMNLESPTTSRSSTPVLNGRVRADSTVAFSTDYAETITIANIKNLDNEKAFREVNPNPSESDLNGTPPLSPSVSGTGGGSSTSSEMSEREVSPMRNTRRNWSPCPRIKHQNSPDRVLLKYNPPGPMDNSDLVDRDVTVKKLRSLTDEGGQLKPGLLVRDSHFKLLGQQLFMALQRWYGASNAVLPRKVILCTESKRPELELYPTTLTVLRHMTGGVGSPRSSSAQSFSWSSTAMSMARGAQEVARQTLTDLQHSAVSQAPRRVPMYTVSFPTNTKIGEMQSFLCRELCLTADNTRLWLLLGNNQADKMSLEDETCTLAELTLDKGGSQILLEVRNKDLTWPEEILDVARTGQVHDNKSHQSGVTGLSNLGNTCFMNSALQCMSNTTPLTQYFRNGVYNYELNRTNRDGTKGQLALAYSRLLNDLWSGSSRVVAPIKFKMTVSKFTDQFPELRQHDCQELLGFLLDALHEDLNRVKEKPYKQLKDSDGRPDEIVAAEAWDNHIRRNKSIIVDLFHGLLKSEVTCKQCNNSSVKFDPFTFLSLPIPYENFLLFFVTVIRLDGSWPVKYGIRLPADSPLLKLREEVANVAKLSEDNLLIVELDLNARFLNFPSLHEKVRRLGTNNLHMQIFAMEIPTQSPIECNGHATPIQSSTPSPTLQPKWKAGHSRSASAMSTSSMCSTRSTVVPQPRILPPSLGTLSGYTFAVHRRMDYHDTYFLAHNRATPVVFGLPIVVPANPAPPHWIPTQMYACVLKQIERLLSPPALPANQNHALDGDLLNPKLNDAYPFRLKITDESGLRCCVCPWYMFCNGCVVNLHAETLDMPDGCILVIEWDLTALHLRYQHSMERHTLEDISVAESTSLQHKPISLESCLQAFTKPEELVDKDTYYCSKCKQHSPAIKKLDIWKLPPILIIHFKRFQQLASGAWVKSCKYVTFPKEKFDPSTFLASANEQLQDVQITSFRDNDQAIAQNESVEEDNEPLCQNGGFKNKKKLINLPSKNNNNVKLQDKERNGVLTGSSIPDHLTVEPDRNRNRTESSGSAILSPMVQPNDHMLMEGVDSDTLNYDLYSIACHYGNLGSGHYTCYARNKNKNWYLYNDSRCKKISNDEIDGSVAYLLFYERSGLDHRKYLPDLQRFLESGDAPDVHNLDEQDTDSRCSLQ